MKAVDEETVFISEFNELVNYHHWDEVKFRLGIQMDLFYIHTLFFEVMHVFIV